MGLNPAKPWELNGKRAWYRGMFLLPSGKHPRYPGRYRYPAAKQASGKGRGWTILWQQHEFQNGRWSQTLMIIPGGHLSVRTAGGVRADHGTESIDFFERVVSDRLPFDKWIEFIVAGLPWSHEVGKGRMEVWLNRGDGMKRVFPTKDMPPNWRNQWYRADGHARGYQYLQYGQYRADPVSYVGLSEDYEDTIYITPLAVGPTRKSVGG